MTTNEFINEKLDAEAIRARLKEAQRDVSLLKKMLKLAEAAEEDDHKRST